MSDVLQLWTAATPNGWKVSIMLEELIEAGVQLPEREVITVDIMSGDQFSEAFTAVECHQRRLFSALLPHFTSRSCALCSAGF